MKKYFFLISLLAMLLPGVTFAQSGVTLENARIRNGSGLNTQILKTVAKGESIELLEQKNDWWKVEYKGTSGFMAGWLISPQGESSLEEVTSTPATFGNTLFASRLRKTPEIGNNIIITLPVQTRVEIILEEGEWFKVKTNSGQQGYVKKELIQTVGAMVSTALTKTNFQEGEVPDGVNLTELNEYWLSKINALRAEKNLRQLVIDSRWIDTASEWAGYMGKKGVATHTRADGKSMHQWIDTKGLAFATRYSENGWKVNYFTENIAWGIASGTTESVKKVLDDTLRFFLSEASSNGDHYRTIYHTDWNSLGLGFYFAPQGSGKYKVFIAMHYGSLVLN